jgi:hypothetical protein
MHLAVPTNPSKLSGKRLSETLSISGSTIQTIAVLLQAIHQTWEQFQASSVQELWQITRTNILQILTALLAVMYDWPAQAHSQHT